jgi:ribosomal protein, L4/L1 family
LALEFALNEKAAAGKLFAVDSVSIESGKTKDAAKIIDTLKLRDALIVKDLLDDNTLLAFRNLANCYLIDVSEINAYLVSTYSAVIIEKAALESITKEG